MLTDGNMRNGVINPASRWPNGVVPFDIDRVFSEYCSTKLKCGLWGVEGIYPFIMCTSLAAVDNGVLGKGVMVIITYTPLITHFHTLTHTCVKPAI